LTVVPDAIESMSIGLTFAGGCMGTAFSWVITASTPSTAEAAVVSMEVIRARPTVECTSAACAMFAYGTSAANWASPLVFTAPSTRSIAWPTYLPAAVVVVVVTGGFWTWVTPRLPRSAACGAWRRSPAAPARS
jgi:hypothetical protein